ncbi:hypothetical protein HMPREF9103_00245 [Lentilactobacillus parafarraginis F0439]|uniref:Uncharacterized protein n=1 Tax=Lentilactobacillus parafarraginis F0439 TaxID=797515 RepID=G9ZKJ7_9LACO|nr:hypothetical protein HMPREF9103_00245 [Lentilactobacillus parafarraginis F0439]
MATLHHPEMSRVGVLGLASSNTFSFGVGVLEEIIMFNTLNI